MTQALEYPQPSVISEEERWTRLSVLVVGLCFLINMLDGMDVLLMSYLAPAIGKDWGLASTSLGVVFSAGLAGMAIGGLLVAPLADRHGRRRLILIALVIMSAGMIISGLARNLLHLILARMIVGVGIGTVLACMAALVAEFAPPRHRSFAVGLLQGGYPIGAIVTGFVTAWALNHFSWNGVLMVAGLISVAAIPLVYWLLPESIAFLLKNQPKGALDKANSLRAHLDLAPLAILPNPATAENSATVVAQLLRPEVRRDTFLLWGAIFSGFMVLYFIVSWIPKLAIEAGLNQQDGIYVGAIYNIGAFVGTVGLAGLADRFGLKPLIISFLLAAAVMLLVFGGVALPLVGVLTVAFALGVALQGGFNGLYPLSTYIYPVEVRSAGLGWAMGIGRAGAVLGPLLGGYILSLHGPLLTLFAVFAVPLVVAAICVRAIKRSN